MSEPLLPVQDERIDADCPCACHELGVADTCLSVCCALARKDKEITDLRREVEIALEAMNARHQDALRLKARLADTEDVLRVSQELVASNRDKRLALEARIVALTDALRLLWHEVQESGNAMAENDGWPKAIAATRACLAQKEKKP
jgi:chromosome segregation ATPase